MINNKKTIHSGLNFKQINPIRKVFHFHLGNFSFLSFCNEKKKIFLSTFLRVESLRKKSDDDRDKG
jgi:hypothetical protein